MLFILHKMAQSYTFDVHSQKWGLQKIAYESLVTLFYHQILDSNLFSLNKDRFCIYFWNWLIVGLIDLSLYWSRMTAHWRWMCRKSEKQIEFIMIMFTCTCGLAKIKASDLCMWGWIHLYSCTHTHTHTRSCAQTSCFESLQRWTLFSNWRYSN